jgi:hypothetical protein
VLDDDYPFEIDDQAAHLIKHAAFGIADIQEVWKSEPLFYPAKPPADWLMVAEVAGSVMVVPLAKPDRGTRGDVGRSAATRRPSCWLTSTARTDEGEVTMKRKEYEFYAKAENQRPQGPARRRKPRLTEMVPVRFPEETLAEVQRRAEADDRSVSAWIRRAVEQELKRTAS